MSRRSAPPRPAPPRPPRPLPRPLRLRGRAKAGPRTASCLQMGKGHGLSVASRVRDRAKKGKSQNVGRPKSKGAALLSTGPRAILSLRFQKCPPRPASVVCLHGLGDDWEGIDRTRPPAGTRRRAPWARSLSEPRSGPSRPRCGSAGRRRGGPVYEWEKPRCAPPAGAAGRTGRGGARGSGTSGRRRQGGQAGNGGDGRGGGGTGAEGGQP